MSKDKVRLLELLKEKQNRIKFNKLKHYKPYAKQREFHTLGAYYNERCFMAGNQLGKSLAGSFEVAMHATGIYPDWWEGKRFKEANVGWACGVTGEAIRDSIQKLIVGDITNPDEIGTGSLPKDTIISTQKAMGTSNLLDYVKVRHIDGGVSTIKFKSYALGREKFQAATIDWVWFDEEPPADIYAEGMTRTNVNGRFGFLTYTPLLGMSETTYSFMREPKKSQVLLNVTIYDVDFMTDGEKEEILNGYRAHERDARAMGIPILGSGRIFQIAEDKIWYDDLDVMPGFYHIGGLDFGWDHPQAGVHLIWDKDTDIIYVDKAFRMSECTPANAAITYNSWGDFPWAWPHDGYQHDKGSGLQLADQYRKAGMTMLQVHATHEHGGNGVEAGLAEMNERMASGRLKIKRSLEDWWEEFRLYHRQDGKIVKKRDDLICATRYALMMRRFARQSWEFEKYGGHENYDDRKGRSVYGGY